MHIETQLAQSGSRNDKITGAVSAPIHLSATYRHPALGDSTGFDYARSQNPTRQLLEQTLADMEKGARAVAFTSGMAAVDAVVKLLKPGDKVLATEDLYGGSYRLFKQVYSAYGIDVIYADTSRADLVAGALGRDSSIKLVFVEALTNPLLKAADIKNISDAVSGQNILLAVDNTFLSPVLSNPIELGADIVIHSGTKYISGHNDVVAGVVVTATAELGDRIATLQNTCGTGLPAFDSWLVLRGMKTLHLRLERQQKNAQSIAEFLRLHPKVTAVHYPGLADDPSHDILSEQSRGYGAMVSFEVADKSSVPIILSSVDVFLFAESLGGVESLITFPAAQTHADIEESVRLKLGVTDTLLRLSLGVENIDDLINDLSQALGRI